MNGTKVIPLLHYIYLPRSLYLYISAAYKIKLYWTLWPYPSRSFRIRGSKSRLICMRGCTYCDCADRRPLFLEKISRSQGKGVPMSIYMYIHTRICIYIYVCVRVRVCIYLSVCLSVILSIHKIHTYTWFGLMQAGMILNNRIDGP